MKRAMCVKYKVQSSDKKVYPACKLLACNVKIQYSFILYVTKWSVDSLT